MENRSTPVVFGDETIRAALSTASLPGILGNVANKRALQSFAAQPIIATRLCSWGDLNDFKESDRFRLSTLGSMEEVTEGGEIKHATLAEEKATNQLKTYGKMLTVSRHCRRRSFRDCHQPGSGPGKDLGSGLFKGKTKFIFRRTIRH